jgi:membrane protein implicated in regulation of membrane protease activity
VPRYYYPVAFLLPLLVGFLVYQLRTSDFSSLWTKSILAVIVTAVLVVAWAKFRRASTKNPEHKRNGPRLLVVLIEVGEERSLSLNATASLMSCA